MLARFRVGHQILMAAIIAAVGFVFVAADLAWTGATLDTIRAKAELGQTTARDAMRFGSLMLQLRRHEKDFLLRADEKYVEAHAATAAEARRLLTDLAGQADRLGDEPLTHAVAAIGAPAGAYLAAFAELVKIRRDMGLDQNTGLEGEMRRSVHELEQAFGAIGEIGLANRVLMLRRHEKDYMLRRQASYIAEHAKVAEALDADIAALDRPLHEKMGLKTFASTYAARFKTWAVASEALAGAQRDVSDSYSKLEPLVAAALARATDVGAGLARDAADTEARNRLTVYAVVAIATLAALGVALGVWRYVAGALIRLEGWMRRIAGGDYHGTSADLQARNEFGSMARALAGFQDQLAEAERLRVEQRAGAATREARARALEALVAEFEAEIGEVVAAVSAAATELRATATTLTGAAEETSRLSNTVAQSAEAAAGQVQAVAAASEELATTVGEIGRRTADQSGISAAAVDEARQTMAAVEELTEAAGKIGAVVELIAEIAGQTNLLALNATIEAARAGEAGKGFAIVASEVKGLAAQTATATADIGQQIGRIQAATNATAAAIARVSGTIDRVSEIGAGIAGAVEEQGATTREISSRIIEVADGAAESSSAIGGVLRASEETAGAAAQVLASSTDLSDQAARLSTRVQGFVARVKAA